MPYDLEIIAKVTVLVALAALAHVALGSNRPTSRHALWVSTTVAMLVLPVLPSLVPAWRVLPAVPWSELAWPLSAGPASVGSAPEERPGLESRAGALGLSRLPRGVDLASAGEPHSVTAVDDRGRPPPNAPALPALLWTWLWAAGVAVALMPVVTSRISIRRLELGARPLPDDEGWRRALSDATQAMGTAPEMRLLMSPGVDTPVTWGVRHPVIVLPEDAGNWPESLRQAVLRHELAHVLRRDALGQLLARLACAIYWFHPGPWWLARTLRAESERACDDRVLLTGIPPRQYAAELLTVARHRRAWRAHPIAVAMAGRSDLEERLRRILRPCRPGSGRRANWALRVAALPATVGLAALAPAPRTLDANGLPASQEVVLSGDPQLPLGSWRVADEPSVEIGAGDGSSEYVFRRIEHAHTLEDGRIVVVDGELNSVRVYSPDGTYLGTTGPNRFASPATHLLPGDTLAVWEDTRRRVSFFAPDGELLRRVEVHRAPRHFLSTRSWVREVSDQRDWITEAARLPQPSQTGPSRYFVRDGDAVSSPDTIVELEGQRYYVVPISQPGPGAAIVAVPFEARDVYVVDRSGRFVTTGTADEQPTVVYRSMAGEVVLQARIEREPIPVTDVDWERAVEFELARHRMAGLTPDRMQTRIAAYPEMERPTHLPAFDELLVDPENRVWARHYLPPMDQEGPREWVVVDAAGRWVTSVSLPAGFEVLEIGAVHVLVRFEDDLGVERLRSLAILRD